MKIDLYSDTKTRPSAGMRQAMFEAEVGDEQQLEDPTVLELVETVASRLGQESAIFLPSGTMANEIAIMLHCEPGSELIAHETSHCLNFESGAPSGLAGAMIKGIRGPNGFFTAEDVHAAIRPKRHLYPQSRLVIVEQTTNMGGGAVWPLDQMQSVVAASREHGLALHLDGARLWNASTASGVSLYDYAKMFDTVFVDFTKGMGAPFGAILAGKSDIIERAWTFKQRLGGSMRQAGIMAAGCLYALNHNFDRLTDDHVNANKLAQLLGEVAGLKVETPATNMVFADTSGLGMSAQQFQDALASDGIRISAVGPHRIRAVTHLDISAADIETVARAIARIAAAT